MDGVKGVTLAELSIQVHNRYAQDQEILSQTQDLALDAAPHFQISVVNPVYSSECDKITGFDKRVQTWGIYSPPPNYTPAKPRGYFGSSILPSLTPQEKAFAEQKQRLLAAELKEGISSEMEAQRTCLFDLLSSLEELEELFQSAQSERLRTQRS